jgi:Holliday junction DNA helicase RuvA
MALALLSGSSVSDIKRAIYKADAGFLRSIPGIGKKLAERLIVELKGKVSEEEEWLSKSEKHRKKEDELIWHDCIQALISLGYRHSAAREALENAMSRSSSSKNAEELIKEALKYVSEK